ncbi:MAG: hypothetical protein LBN36_07685 [Clostridiales Family XIII bacterium]|jgi:hypothetical protein|nr:hypothetical protein [Clostridiales Family XIII bacterium]
MKKDLQIKLKARQTRVALRYEYYEQKKGMLNFNIAVPDTMKSLTSVLGWCGKAVDSLSDRLIFRDFLDDDFGIGDIYNMNNPDILFDSAISAALIGACSFLYVTQDAAGNPIIQVIDGCNATGTIDETTGMLTEGYAVLKRDKKGKAVTEAYFEPNKTTVTEDGVDTVFKHPVAYPLLVPVIYRPSAKRPFGHSYISRSCMNIIQQARETVRLMMVSAQFFSFPQRYVVGTDEKMDFERWKVAIATMFSIDRGESDVVPHVGQFEQQSMEPLFAQLKTYAALFSGETGLTIEELGFKESNPSSAEAIQNMREPMIRNALKAQRNFGSAFLNAGICAASLRDGVGYERSEFYRTKARWMPVFSPNLTGATGDAIQKINMAIPGFFDKEMLSTLLGIEPADGGEAIDLGEVFDGQSE